MRMLALMLALAPALTTLAAQAQTAPAPAPAPATALRISPGKIDAALARMVTDGRAAGVSALVWKNGREAYFGTAGMADREAARPMRRDTIAQIYSMTKPVTGVALMQLWEQGKFGLDDPLARYLPEFASMQVYTGKDANGAATYVPADRPITIRDILRHTAGFAYGAGPTPAHDAFVAADPLALDHDLAEASRRVAALPLLFQPGAQWSYSVGVTIQAALVEKLSGQRFADYVKAHILDPLGMKDTRWREPDAARPRFAAMYVMQDGKLVRQEDAKTADAQFPRKCADPRGIRAGIDA